MLLSVYNHMLDCDMMFMFLTWLQASAQVEDLQKNLVEEQKIVAEKKEKTGALIEAIGKEKVQVDAAVEAGREDEEAAAAIKAEVEAFQEECAKDLEAAEPVIAEAEAALNSLDKASLGELKSFGSPAAEVVQVSLDCHMITLGRCFRARCPKAAPSAPILMFQFCFTCRSCQHVWF